MPSPAQLRKAIEAMVRLRAVESVPDPQGARTIWHRGAEGAELVSWVEASGRLVKQQLTLFEDVIVWQHGTRVRTGALLKNRQRLEAPVAADALYDTTPDGPRLERMRLAVEKYAGNDKYIEHLVRVVELSHGHAFGSAQVVTRSSNELLQRRFKKGAAAEANDRRRTVVLVSLAVTAVIALLAVLFTRRG